MNLPNKLTCLRVVLVPFFVFFLLYRNGEIPLLRYTALAIFIIASLTDLVDGKLARKYNLVTDFGKFMDPLADKLLVSAGLICMVGLGQLPAWFVILIISRDFIISGFRLVASDNGVVIAASWWGKWKTTIQMFMLIFLILNLPNPGFMLAAEILEWTALALTIISLLDYIAKNHQILTKGDI